MILRARARVFVMLRTRSTWPAWHRAGEWWQCLRPAGPGACGDGG
jgi:hypothetical protein